MDPDRLDIAEEIVDRDLIEFFIEEMRAQTDFNSYEASISIISTFAFVGG